MEITNTLHEIKEEISNTIKSVELAQGSLETRGYDKGKGELKAVYEKLIEAKMWLERFFKETGP